MRAFVTAGALIGIGLGMWGCGGSGYSSGSGNPTSPTPPPSGSGVVTINVVAINGAQSFSPNPATVPAGRMVRLHRAGRHEPVRDDEKKEFVQLLLNMAAQADVARREL